MTTGKEISLTRARVNYKLQKARVSLPANPVISVKLKRTKAQWDRLLKRARKVAGERARSFGEEDNQ